MIVKMINDDGIWIPSPKLFLNIFNQTGLELSSEEDKDIIITRLNKELEKEHSVWDFNIKLKINVLTSEDKSVPCNIRIIKSREDDNCTACIIFRTKSDKLNIRDFEYRFTKEDL